MDLRVLDVCLAMNTRGENGVSYWFTWYMFWHSTRGFPRWHWGNLCIGVDARFHPCFPGKNLGELFEVIYVGLNIMNLKLFDAYHIIDPRKLVMTLEYIGDIRVDCVLRCYSSMNSRIYWTDRIASCYFSTNSRIDQSERIALRWFCTLQTIPSYVLR